jgi:hypothetical protein
MAANIRFRPIADISLFHDAARTRKLATIALLLALGACDEQLDETYATWAEANQAGAVKRGCIPAFVPPSAYDIRERHDLDTNAQRLEFTVPPSDVGRMVAGLREVSADDRIAAVELSEKLGLAGASEVYVVCSDVLNGALIVDRRSGRAAYETPVRWADDDCSEAV